MKTSNLFILKRKNVYGSYGTNVIDSGLYNSARMVVDMLNRNGVEANLEQVIDGNCVDRLVTKYRPNTVVLEAIWMPITKLEELTKLHSTVQWIVRLHSDMPFLANEGNAIGYIKQYELIDRVHIAVNSPYAKEALEVFMNKEIIYFPNYYPVNGSNEINLGCFEDMIEDWITTITYIPKEKPLTVIEKIKKWVFSKI